MATRVFSSISNPSAYVLVPLRVAADFILYRSQQHGDPLPILAVGSATEHPSPQAALSTNTRSQANSMQHGRLLETGCYNTVSFKLVSELRGVTFTNRPCERFDCESIL